jgi:hypothetical protein
VCDQCHARLQEDVRSRLQDMSQWRSGKLMTFDKVNAHVRAHFSESLVVLLREVRQLQALGLSCRKDIQAEVDVAAKFYRWGGAGCCLLLYKLLGVRVLALLLLRSLRSVCPAVVCTGGAI